MSGVVGSLLRALQAGHSAVSLGVPGSQPGNCRRAAFPFFPECLAIGLEHFDFNRSPLFCSGL